MRNEYRLFLVIASIGAVLSIVGLNAAIAAHAAVNTDVPGPNGKCIGNPHENPSEGPREAPPTGNPHVGGASGNPHSTPASAC